MENTLFIHFLTGEESIWNDDANSLGSFVMLMSRGSEGAKAALEQVSDLATRSTEVLNTSVAKPHRILSLGEIRRKNKRSLSFGAIWPGILRISILKARTRHMEIAWLSRLRGQARRRDRPKIPSGNLT